MVPAKPRITMVAGHCCIRVHKMGVPLHQKGYEVHLVLHGYPTQVKRQYRSIHVFETEKHLANLVRIIDRHTDIYHVHNEPSYFVTIIRENSKKPIVLDFHDSFLLREEKPWVDERNNAFLADGFCYPSEPMEKALKVWTRKKPGVVLFSFVPMNLFRWDFLIRYEGGLCYEGRIDLPPKVKKPKTEWDYYGYCEYTNLAEKLKKVKIPFYLYSGREHVLEYYKDKAYVAGGFEFYELIRRLSRHEWGLIGNIDNHAEWDGAMPNKLFEYIAAGIPVVAMNASYAGQWLEKEGVGINIKTVKELKQRWDERFQCKEILAKKRLNYTMENHIQKLEKLYEKIIHL